MRRAALISIHAPPRGATMDFTHSLSACRISIHAPPRGATVSLCMVLHELAFQFTPLREGRLGKANQVCCRLAISIHAPPRGATAPVRAAHQHNGDFNSRPSARGDCPRRDGIRQERLFQFTPLREGRRWLPSRPSQAHHFNSRPSARGDVRCPSPRYAS